MDELVSQVTQMKQVLACAKDEDKPGLQMMIDELEQLLSMYSDSSELESSVPVCGNPGSSSATSAICNNDEDEEYLRFQAEIAEIGGDSASSDEKEAGCSELSQSSVLPQEKSKDTVIAESLYESSETDPSQTLKDELSALEGMKCKAPHEHHWGQNGYYNAIVLNVEESDCDSLDSIFVRVVFSQPLVESMLPCSYYMEGRCNYDDGACKYSHGEIVSLSQLKEYVEPDFSKITSGSRVLAKYSDRLWYKATVTEVTDSGNCEVKYDSYAENFTVPLHETAPLYHDENSVSENSSSDDSDGDDESSNEDVITSDMMFLQMRATGALGDWEKHTRGIGSKLMAKMGYVLGTGLGRKGEGRIEPVDAVVLPPGRSLDMCMELKEKAGDQNIFSVERRLKRQKKKEAQRAQREEARSKETESVFNFLNTKLSQSLSKNKGEFKKNTVNVQELNKETAKNLNKKMLNLGENIKQVNKDIAKLKEGMKRHQGRDQETVDKMKSKLESMEHVLSNLKKSEVAIESEQRQRIDKKKLSIF